MSKHSPAALPPCSYRNHEIEAVYAARFIVLPWEELVAAAARIWSSKDQDAALDYILRVSSEGCAASEADQFLEIYLKLLDSTGLMKEETSHHQDLVESPTWGLINGVCVCERLQFLRAQSASESLEDSKRVLALGAAAHLHLFRRFLFVQIMPVVELLHVLSDLELPENRRRPVQRLNELARHLQGGPAGDPVVELLQELPGRWLGPGEVRPVRLEALRKFILSALRQDIVTPGGWTSCFDSVWRLFSQDPLQSGCVQYLRRSLDTGQPRCRDGAGEAVIIPTVVLRYLLHTRGGGITPMLAQLALGRFGRSVLSFFRSLASTDPYSLSRVSGRRTTERRWVSIPGLRAFHQQRNIIIDPLAFASRSGRRHVNHPGIENLGRVRDHQGYVADHFIVRRAVEAWIDPELNWMPKLEDFMRRWVGLESAGKDWRRIESVFEQVDQQTRSIASQFAAISRSSAIPSSWYSCCIENHEMARQILDRYLEETSPCRSPLFSLLHGFYIHGL